MNNFQKYLEFDSIEDGNKCLAQALSIRDKMGGALYWNIANDDCNEIRDKISRLSLIEFKLYEFNIKDIQSYLRLKKLMNLNSNTYLVINNDTHKKLEQIDNIYIELFYKKHKTKQINK